MKHFLREMPICTTTRYENTTIRMVKIKIGDPTKC